MRGVVLSLIMFVWCGTVVAQKTDSWSSLKKNVVGSQIEPNKYYLVEGDLNQIRNENPDLKIWKTLDKSHHIVSGSRNILADHIWNADNRWKLSLSDEKPNLFTIVTKSEDNLDLPNGLKVIRRFPDRNTSIIEGDLSEVTDALLSNPEIVHITDRVLTPSVESRVIDLYLRR